MPSGRMTSATPAFGESWWSNEKRGNNNAALREPHNWQHDLTAKPRISQSRAITRPIGGSSISAWGVLSGQDLAACRMTRREVCIAVSGDPVILGDRYLYRRNNGFLQRIARPQASELDQRPYGACATATQRIGVEVR